MKSSFPALALLCLLAAACGPPLPPPPTPTAVAANPNGHATAVPTLALPAITASPTAVPPTAAPPASPAPSASVANALASLRGLTIDSFFEASYRQLLRRDPEKITELGIAAKLGLRNDQLTDVSDAYIRDTQRLQAGILELLRGYDREKLSPAQRVSYDVYEWYLDDQVRGHEFMYDDYLLSPVLVSFHTDLIQFFTEIHPVRNQQEAEDYLIRLAQVDTKAEQVIDGLKRREAVGVVLPKFYIPVVVRDLNRVATAAPEATPFYTAFQAKVNALTGVTSADKQALLRGAVLEIQTAVQPAFRSLAAFLESQQSRASDDAGVWKFPNGADYYAYLLRHYTTTFLSANEIHEIGLQEVARLQNELRAALRELQYSTDASIPTLIGRAAQDSGSVQGPAIAAEYERLIRAAETSVAPAFDLFPKSRVRVVVGPTGGYYLPPALDGSRPGAFYAEGVGAVYKFNMPTLVYHETVPGHHTQIGIAQQLALPLFRNDITFDGYTEGWALYAERLAFDLGMYKDDPYGNVGRLQAELHRAARLVVDTGINAKRWTYSRAVDYMLENTGLPRAVVESEVARYIAWPGQATAYKIGMLKLLELRQRAKDRLGASFDLKQFHNIVLGSGSMPLEILEREVDAWVAGQPVN